MTDLSASLWQRYVERPGMLAVGDVRRFVARLKNQRLLLVEEIQARWQVEESLVPRGSLVLAAVAPSAAVVAVPTAERPSPVGSTASRTYRYPPPDSRQLIELRYRTGVSAAGQLAARHPSRIVVPAAALAPSSPVAQTSSTPQTQSTTRGGRLGPPIDAAVLRETIRSSSGAVTAGPIVSGTFPVQQVTGSAIPPAPLASGPTPQPVATALTRLPLTSDAVPRPRESDAFTTASRVTEAPRSSDAVPLPREGDVVPTVSQATDMPLRRSTTGSQFLTSERNSSALETLAAERLAARHPLENDAFPTLSRAADTGTQTGTRSRFLSTERYSSAGETSNAEGPAALPLVAGIAASPRANEAAAPSSDLTLATPPRGVAGLQQTDPAHALGTPPTQQPMERTPTRTSSQAAKGIDMDEVVERALRQLTRRIAVEAERRGWSRWTG